MFLPAQLVQDLVYQQYSINHFSPQGRVQSCGETTMGGDAAWSDRRPPNLLRSERWRRVWHCRPSSFAFAPRRSWHWLGTGKTTNQAASISAAARANGAFCCAAVSCGAELWNCAETAAWSCWAPTPFHDWRLVAPGFGREDASANEEIPLLTCL